MLIKTRHFILPLLSYQPELISWMTNWRHREYNLVIGISSTGYQININYFIICLVNNKPPWLYPGHTINYHCFIIVFVLIIFDYQFWFHMYVRLQLGHELCPQEHSMMETLPNKLKSSKSRSPSKDWAFIVLDFRNFLKGLLDSFLVFLTKSSCKEYFFLLSPPTVLRLKGLK